MNELLTLIKRTWENGEHRESVRTVFCGVRSVRYREFYASYATDYHPELVFVLADYLDYDGETLAEYQGQRYRILRTYRTGLALELTAERAPREEEE